MYTILALDQGLCFVVVGQAKFVFTAIIPCLYNEVQVKEAIFKTLISNGMFDNAHIRLTLTRGKKVIYSKTLAG